MLNDRFKKEKNPELLLLGSTNLFYLTLLADFINSTATESFPLKKMLNLLPKSGMSDGDDGSYPAEKIVMWSLSFGAEIVLQRQDFRHMFVRSLLQKTVLVHCRDGSYISKTADFQYLKIGNPKRVIGNVASCQGRTGWSCHT